MSQKKFKVQTILDLDYNKRNHCKLFYSSTKLIANDSNIYDAFKSMYQSIVTRIENCADKNLIVLDVFVKHSTVLRFLSFSIR